MDDEDAVNVWSCIQTYRIESAKLLLKRYVNQTAALEQLKTYPEKADYHGHKSGSSGEAESPDASANLGKAITYLTVNAPPLPVAVAKVRVAVHPQQRLNLSKTQVLTGIIKNNSNLQTMDSLLAAQDPLWHKDRTAWSEYALKYRAKKGKDPVKR